MKNSIQQIAEKFIINLQEYFSGNREIRIDKLENELLEKARSCAAEMTSAYVELFDSFMLADKQDRKQEKYVIVRKNDMRRIQTEIGEIAFKRTYYRNSDTHEYAYLEDRAIGFEAYTHVSNGLGLALVGTAKDTLDCIQRRIVRWACASINGFGGIGGEQSCGWNRLEKESPTCFHTGLS